MMDGSTQSTRHGVPGLPPAARRRPMRATRVIFWTPIALSLSAVATIIATTH